MQKSAKFRNFPRRGLAQLPENAELPESAQLAQMPEMPALARPNFRGWAVRMPGRTHFARKLPVLPECPMPEWSPLLFTHNECRPPMTAMLISYPHTSRNFFISSIFLEAGLKL